MTPSPRGYFPCQIWQGVYHLFLRSHNTVISFGSNTQTFFPFLVKVVPYQRPHTKTDHTFVWPPPVVFFQSTPTFNNFLRKCFGAVWLNSSRALGVIHKTFLRPCLDYAAVSVIGCGPADSNEDLIRNCHLIRTYILEFLISDTSVVLLKQVRIVSVKAAPMSILQTVTPVVQWFQQLLLGTGWGRSRGRGVLPQ